MTGLTCMGFSAWGAQQGNRYRAVSPDLARGVYQCWQIGEEAAASIAEPTAATIAEHVPESWLNVMTAGIDPLQAVGALAVILQQCQASQDALVKQWQTIMQQVNSPPAEDVPREDLPPDVRPETFGGGDSIGDYLSDPRNASDHGQQPQG